MEKTLILIKPDAVQRALIGDILRLYEVNGLRIEALKMIVPSDSLLAAHYAEHIGKGFYNELVEFMKSGQVVAAVVVGDGVVDAVRELHGATDPSKARFGTVRHMYGTDVQRNVVHGSADLASARVEIGIWFSELNL